MTLELSFKGVTGLALVKIAAPEQPQPEDDPDDEQPVDGKVIWANDDVCLTGKMPGNAVVDATPVTVEIDGQKVLAAYDIKIYANANQKAKGKTWQPADNKVTVFFRSAEFTECESVDVYHLADEAAEPEFVSTVAPDDHGAVEFEAASFSVYVVVSHEEETVLVPKGDPEKPLTRTDIIDKLRVCTQGQADEETLMNGEIECPNCGETLQFEFEEDDDDDEDDDE